MKKAFKKAAKAHFCRGPAEELIVLYDLKPTSLTLPGNPPFRIPSSRLLQLRQCPQCDTFYLYRTDYEFLWGGSENEQILERLTDEQALACLEKTDPKTVTGAAPYQPAGLSAAKPEDSIAAARQKNKDWIIMKLEACLASGDYDDMSEALKDLDDGTCDYLELIPILERFAGVIFYHYDDNGAGGLPRADSRGGTGYEWKASSAIKNIRENAAFESGSEAARALKSNDRDLIKTTLERLKAEGVCNDRLLIPILTKIARKHVYESYDFAGGDKTKTRFEDLARDVIEIIHQNFQRDENDEYCRLCEPLHDDLKINTARGERFPESFDRLVKVDGSFNSPLRRCPACGIYFKWIELSVRNVLAEKRIEQLIRLSAKSSMILDDLFSNAPQNRFEPGDVEALIDTLPIESLLPALRKHVYPVPQIVTPFIPHLLRILERTDNPSIEDLLIDYLSTRTDGDLEILAAFRSTAGSGTSRFLNLLRKCSTAADKNN